MLQQLPLETINGWSLNTLIQTLGIECVALDATVSFPGKRSTQLAGNL